RAYRAAQPIATTVASGPGRLLCSGSEIECGQRAWLSAGGRQVGSVWGHGAYLAPDWSADWLHREALALREKLAQYHYQQSFETLGVGQQAEIGALLKQEMRTNRYDAATDTLTVSDLRAEAIRE